METETRTCQNCKNNFTIEPDDFSFYEKMKVPAPTFCPECRMQRRYMFRNERVFYRRECDLCGKNIISIFSKEKNLKVFCNKCWWGDGWDPSNYCLDYDPKKNLFEQIKELQYKTPFMEKIVSYLTLVNSDYVNHCGNCKNCYLIFNAEFCENVYYTSDCAGLRDCADLTMGKDSELLYGCIGGSGSSHVYFSNNCSQCINVWYSKNCVGCTNCFGCVNLRKKSNCIYNEQYTKEQYEEKIKEMQLDRYSSHIRIQSTIYDFWHKFPNRYVHGRMNQNASGEYVINSKNAKHCYQAISVEDSAYCQLITMPTFRDSYDITEWGSGVEKCIEGLTVGDGAYEVKYSSCVWSNVSDIEYSMYLVNCKNCFGCVNLRKKEYCILNKQYTKEEYFSLREKIIADLQQNPYIDIMGRMWKYGEFLPYDLSPFSYNESFADQYFPLTKEEIESKGFSYIEPIKADYTATIHLGDILDSIHDVPDSFTKEILQCNCGKFYRIVPGELQLLKRFEIPVPRTCPDCRNMARIKQLHSFRLYHRTCDKCGVSIETSYSPDQPEIVYCEKCYQQEVV